MKRILSLALVLVAVSAVAWFVIRSSGVISVAPIAALLPRETVFFVHAPDFNRTREQWHQLDIYQLFNEPAVQEFLRKPMTRLPRKEAASQTLQDVEQLDPRDAFFALTFIDRNSLRFAGGFRFRGSEADAEKVIGKWRAKLFENNSTAKRETVEYEKHKIDTVSVPPFTFTSVYAGHWFFVANDVSELKRLLDRADNRNYDRQATLEGDDAYHAAVAHMPSGYAALFYLQPKRFAEELNSLRAAIGSLGPAQGSQLDQIHSVCGATRLEDGKMHDFLFVGMQKIEQTRPLVRSSLKLGTKDTALYLALLLDIAEKIQILGKAPGINEKIQQIFQTFDDAGITAEHWKAAFEPEVGALADWPQSSHWPSLLLTMPVIDSGKASEIVETAMRIDEDSEWERTEKDGVRYFFMRSPASLVSIMPTFALSDQIMVLGLNEASVEAAVKRSLSGTTELADAQTFKAASHLIPAPTNFFAYVDTALLYARLDSAVRPIVLMAAAFIPGIHDYVDIDKFPAVDVITKHLNPIVSSQRYERDGYVSESVGPLTLNQAAIGLVILGVGITNDQGARGGTGSWLPGIPTPAPSGTP